MLILTLDSALDRVSAALVDGDRVLVAGIRDMARGIALLPGLAEAVLARFGRKATAFDAIGVTVGPGGFTGVRGALALAHGIGLGTGVPVVGVTVPEALTAIAPRQSGRALWIAIDNRRGGAFLARRDQTTAVSLESLPRPDGPIALSGDAARAMAMRLDDADVILTGASLPEPVGIARVARARLRGEVPPLAAQPIYIESPAVSAPTAMRRSAPVA